MAFRRYTEVFVGLDKEAFERAKGILEQNGIAYGQRLVGSHDIFGKRGSGTRNIQYYLYVDRAEQALAHYLLR